MPRLPFPSASPPLRAITLDLDDTLWAVGPTLVEAERVLGAWLGAHAPATAARLDAEARAAIRRELVAEDPGRAHDMSWLRREGLRRAMRRYGDDPRLADDAFEVFLDARQRVTFFDDVLPVLERWAGRYRLVAVTNGNADVARVGLGRLFSAAVNAHVFGCAKPDPRLFHEACRLAGVAPEATLHVGDDPELDVVAARRAGLQAAWLRRPEFAHRHPADACGEHAPGPFEDLHALDAALAGR
ncbi:MAG: HAD family hydrolase [Burkholderiales bacterium]|nr:MAG: HAD family hydrolase [Burkholderiales bacterium]